MGRHAAAVPPDLGGPLSTGALHVALHAWTGAPPAEDPEARVDTGALQQAVRAWSGASAPIPPRQPGLPARTADGGATRRLPTAALPTGQLPVVAAPLAVDTGELQQAVAAWSAAPAPAAQEADEDVLRGQVEDQPYAPRGARGTPAAAPSPVRAPSLAAPTLDTAPTRIVRPDPDCEQPGRNRLAKLLGLRRR